MRYIPAEENVPIAIGRLGENISTSVVFDIEADKKEYPNATFALLHRRAKDPAAYPVSSEYITFDEKKMYWLIQSGDLAYRGNGLCEYIVTEGEAILKSAYYTTYVDDALDGSGNPPDPWATWVQQVLAAAETVEQAVAHMPTIVNGNWYMWNAETGEYEDSGVQAEGHDGYSPTVTVEVIDGGHRITITDVSGPHTFDVMDGTTEDFIDDTAGKGVTNKTWSANKLDGELTDVKTAIHGKMDAPETEGTSGQVLGLDGNLKPEWKTVSGGGTVDSSLSTSSENPVQNKVITKEINALKDSEAYTYTSITDGKYVKYADGSTPSLSGSKVIDFPVVENMKIKYSATIGTPDLRGLAYYDINGFYISGVQMLSTEQTITVPAKAVKCKATISNAEQIAIFSYNKTITDNVVSSASVDYVSELTGGEIITLSNGTRYNNATNNESSINTYSGNFASAKVSCEAGDQFVYSAKYNGNSNYRVWAFYDSTGTKISDSGTIAEISEYKTITAPANAKTLYFDSMTNDGVTPFLCKGLYPAQLLESLTPSATNPFAKINDGAGLLSIFHTVGCIGDSLASGESAYKSGGTTRYIDQYPFSWGQCLARMTGNTYYNFSKGGLTTKTWLSSQFATDCFDGNHDCNAYFIGLGQNDKNVSMTVGTTEDINLSDYTQNADTYCGNYGKIIQKLKELQPKAKIFCFTDPNPPMDDNNYNNAVKAVVQLFDNCYLIDLYTYRTRFIGSSFIGQNLRAGHYNATGYQEIAKMIATYVDWFIRQNVSEFTQVEFIGTSYEWTT